MAVFSHLKEVPRGQTEALIGGGVATECSGIMLDEAIGMGLTEIPELPVCNASMGEQQPCNSEISTKPSKSVVLICTRSWGPDPYPPLYPGG